MTLEVRIEEAIDVVARLEGGDPSDPEFRAVVSHWLQNLGQPPIGRTEEDAKTWTEAIVSNLYRGQGQLPPPSDGFRVKFDIPFHLPDGKEKFRFIDLFAGIGGFRLALQSVGGRCVFSSEIDPAAQQTYFANFGEVPFGDIREFTGPDVTDEELKRLIPDHDILAAGFPCQPFSKAGVSARESLGLDHGFADSVKGTLFFDIVRIAAVKKPRVLFLENVRNLESHDGGRTFRTIRETIEGIGYTFSSMVIDAAKLVPQRRQRSFMVCFKDGEPFEFEDGPFTNGDDLPLKDALEDDVSAEFTISDRLWSGHRSRTKRNLERGVGFTAHLADLNRPANTLVARYGKDGKECLIPQEGRNPRMLTPRECARLQGFPERFVIPVVKTVAYRQFGNAVAVPVVTEVARQIVSQQDL